MCLTVAILLTVWNVFGSSEGDASTPLKSRSPSRFETASTSARDGSATASPPFNLVDDEGQTLWVSPTNGRPVDLAYLPPGVQIIVALRPESLAGHREGEKVIDGLGPMARQGVDLLDKLLLVPGGVRQLVVGLSVTSDGRWRSALVARLSDGPSAAEHIAAKLPNAAKKIHHGIDYAVANEMAYYAPAGDKKCIVVAPEPSIAEIIDLHGETPPLRREVERLLAHTDADRHVTMIVAPNFLFSEGQAIFNGQMAPLREPLYWFLGDEFGAAALSLHWDDDFFVELLAVPTLDTSPQRAARLLADRVAQISDGVEEYVVGLEAQAYGRRILARFPAMVRKLAAYTRSGFEADHAVLRCYLPAIAGHNLLMGTELTLAESIAGRQAQASVKTPASTVTEVTAPSDGNASLTVRDRLRRDASLAFARETLEAAVEQISRDIGVDIVIAGADLQAEGITKNQSFGIDLANRRAEEILVEILRLANPDKSATAPSDPRQKLIYVISAEPGQTEKIVITTRAGAAARGDQLPAVFRAK